MAERRDSQDGLGRVQPLTEGYLRKGGLNPPTQGVFRRPPPPAPMRAAQTPPAPLDPHRRRGAVRASPAQGVATWLTNPS